MAAMRTPRASNFLYLVMGALSVAIVATVLVASGAFDRENAGARASATATATPAATSSSSAAVPTDVSDIYRQVSPGVVYIASTTSQGQASGSGWVYDSDGTIVTNDHVVEGADKVSVRFTENGSPFGLQGTVTSGIVSALGREIKAPNNFTISGVIQTDAAINPGNSGGPLLDDGGRVIGINSQIATNGSDSNSGVGFAVPIDTVKQVVPQLKADGKIARAWLGVSTSDAAPRDGAVVQQVTGAPAQKAGLRPGDMILQFGDRTIATASDLGQAVNTHKAG